MKRKLEARKEHQTYWTRDGIGPLPGCSSICKLAEDTGGLIHWSWKKGMDGEDYRTERDAAADSGTIAHALVESHLIGDELDLSEFSEEAQELGRKAFDSFMLWWEDKKMVFISAELQLVSHDHLFGGTLDILARDPEDKVCLIDLKKVKALRASHAIQAGGYSLLVGENFPDDKVDEICLLRLLPSGKVAEPLWLDPENFPYYNRAFLCNLASLNARKELENILPPKLRAWRKKS